MSKRISFSHEVSVLGFYHPDGVVQRGLPEGMEALFLGSGDSPAEALQEALSLARQSNWDVDLVDNNLAERPCVCDVPGGEQSEMFCYVELSLSRRVKLDDFTRGYLEAALWTGRDEDEESLDGLYGVDDLAPETLKEVLQDCKHFLASAEDGELGEEVMAAVWQDEGNAGHDFLLTRNGHGAGFGFGDYPEPVDRRLYEMAKTWGTFELYAHDGVVYHHG